MLEDPTIIAIGLAAVSGVPGLCFRRSSNLGQLFAVVLLGVSASLGLFGVYHVFRFGHYPLTFFPWQAVGNSLIETDHLAAFFLIPIFVMGFLGAIYGLSYWPQRHHPSNGRKVCLFWGLLVAGMALLVVSRHALALLLGWEVMALAAFFLIAAEDTRAECRRAGFFYLISTHLGTLALLAMFALWRSTTGSFALTPVAAGAMSPPAMNAIFFLAIIGFGVKAGIMPLHFWLPSAHANAPSHVSAMLSGVMIKMGIFGLLRMVSLMPTPPTVWGGILLALGATSGLFGVLFAIGQHDIKRLLAYHSIENIGIILLGFGLAMLGRSLDRPEWVVLGMAGCLLHVWNHGLFKSLLFMCAGSVVHAAHTRDIDRLGGLAKKMPWTAALFVIGAVAICGLPPLNGFVSELFVYLGLFKTVVQDGKSGTFAVVAVPILAMIGALAVACFVKVFGTVFLGEPRTNDTDHAHESPFLMRGPMLMLAAGCFGIGLAPAMIAPILDGVIQSWMPDLPHRGMSIAEIAPVQYVGRFAFTLIVLIAGLSLLALRYIRVSQRVGTWDCGYSRPTSRMQYTASSFAQMIVGLFRWVLHPKMHEPKLENYFPPAGAMHSEVDDVVLDRVLLPSGRFAVRWVAWLRTFQHGMTQQYVLYILITVVVMLSTLLPIADSLAKLFAR